MSSEFLVQEVSPDEWPSRNLDRGKERPVPTLAERDAMTRELVVLGKLLEDSGVWWQLDGALNISILREDYIGVHGDVDVSFIREDLPQLEKHLSLRGYGMFRYLQKEQPDGSKHRTLHRVGALEFRGGADAARDWWQLRLIAVDERGKFYRDSDHPVLDTAVMERNPAGRPTGWRDVVFPDRWLEGEAVDFHGVSINLSHPARFIFNKMFFRRHFDEKDLHQYAETGVVTAQNLDEVEQVLGQLKRQEDMEDAVTWAERRIDQIRNWL
jgi:hypothetical protein